MSPDNWKSNPVVKRLIQTSTDFTSALPSLGKHMLAEDMSFRGLTMFIGDTADVVVGYRAFDDDGTPVVMWSSGSSVLEALINIDKAVGTGNFKVDKKALTASPPK